MAGVNKVIIIGNLGNDPDMRYMPNGDAVANISVATSDTWNDKQTGEKREKTEWHRIVAFRRLGEIIGQYCKKGSKIYIEGKLQTRKWTDKQGVDHYTTEIIADQMQMLDSRSGGSSGFNNQSNQYANQAPQASGDFNPTNNPPQANQNQSGGLNQPVKPNANNLGPAIDSSFEDDEIPF